MFAPLEGLIWGQLASTFTVLNIWQYTLVGYISLLDVVPYGQYFFVKRPAATANGAKATLGSGGYYTLFFFYI